MERLLKTTISKNTQPLKTNNNIQKKTLIQSLTPGQSNLTVELINEGLGSLVGKEVSLQYPFDNGETYTISSLEEIGDRETFAFTQELKVEKTLGEVPVCVKIVAGSMAEDINPSNDLLCKIYASDFLGLTSLVHLSKPISIR
ncbi:MAG: hypothetical protein ACJATA_000727 [Sphingobacteriales bacterium]|jgi:hypothetical protein